MTAHEWARERALEARRVVEAWEAAEERTGLAALQAETPRDRTATRKRHDRAVDQLYAARRLEEVAREAWLAGRPLGGHQ